MVPGVRCRGNLHPGVRCIGSFGVCYRLAISRRKEPAKPLTRSYEDSLNGTGPGSVGLHEYHSTAFVMDSQRHPTTGVVLNAKTSCGLW